MMRIVITLATALILMQCEWRPTLLLLADSGCCVTSCCRSECGPEDSSGKQDDTTDDAASGLLQCCKVCAYYPSSTIQLTCYVAECETVFEDQKIEVSTFSSDCFHPPEATVFFMII